MEKVFQSKKAAARARLIQEWKKQLKTGYKDLHATLDKGSDDFDILELCIKVEGLEKKLAKYKVWKRKELERQDTENPQQDREQDETLEGISRYWTTGKSACNIETEIIPEYWNELKTIHINEQKAFYSVATSDLWSKNGKGKIRPSKEALNHWGFYQWKRENRVKRIEKWIETASRQNLRKGLKKLKIKQSESVKNCLKINCFTECFLKKEQYQELKQAIIERLNGR
jgi:hypothetical protein